MKKFILPVLLGMLLFSCSNSADDSIEQEDKTKASEVFVYSGGNQLNITKSSLDPKSEIGYSIPDDGKYLVYYYIRIDGNIPGEGDNHFKSSDYFPRTKALKTRICDLNHGYVAANVDWKSCASFSKYIYSKDGSAVKSIIVEEPTIEQLLAANQGAGDDMNGYLEHKDDLHFIWYVCKKQDSDHLWHIDGVLTTKDRNTIEETDYGKEIIENYGKKGMADDKGDVKRKASVEVDVHQQEHKDWNEIKTSIHLRDTVTAEVFLPIEYQELADDFDIRAGKDFKYITEIKNTQITIGGNTYDLQVSITHEVGGIRIIVQPNKEALIAARKEYDDGLTFEVHSYVTPGVPTDTIWEKLKKTTCKVSPYTKLYGQITSAYYDDKVLIK